MGCFVHLCLKGSFKCYVMPWGVGCQLSRKKVNEGVRFNIISVTRGWVGVKFPGKKRYVPLEWPIRARGFVLGGFVLCRVGVHY